MSVKVYGCNHIAIEVDDVERAVAFYQDVFGLEKLDEGEGDAFFKLGEHQFLAMFRVSEIRPERMRHFGLMVRDEQQIAEVREKLTKKYGIKLIPGFRCDFVDPFGKPRASRRPARGVTGLAAALPGSPEGGNRLQWAIAATSSSRESIRSRSFCSSIEPFAVVYASKYMSG